MLIFSKADSTPITLIQVMMSVLPVDDMEMSVQSWRDYGSNLKGLTSIIELHAMSIS